ncbi:MAG TPA: class I SAM-dependent methyltransferase [Candidatus Paceibacterota bacterium]
MGLYYTLFKDYNKKQFEHSINLQMERFRRYGLTMEKCLDVGCGGGRSIIALQRLGAKEVIGSEVDEKLADLAHERTGAKIYKGSALSLPFQDETFDTVICSGVLHHTNNIAKGVGEIQRVLKQGGQVYFLFYYEHPVWKKTHIIRFICKCIPLSVMRAAFFFVPANKRYLMDNWYVEHMYISTKKDIQNLMKEFSEWRIVDEPPPHNIRIIAKK